MRFFIPFTLFFLPTTDTYSFSFPKVLNKEEDEEGEDEEDDEDTVATALSNACITESAKEKEAMKDVPQLDLVFVVRAWLR